MGQSIADVLEETIGAVVTVGVYKTDIAKHSLGFRGESAPDLAYEKALDLAEVSGSGSGFIIEKNGKPRGLRGVVFDLTERKKMEGDLRKAKEKAEGAAKLISSFLANISHEIRTPMNAIMGFSSLLADKNISTDAKNLYIQYIKNKGNDLINIIESIVNISKIEAGTVTITKSHFNIHKLLIPLYHSYNEFLIF